MLASNSCVFECSKLGPLSRCHPAASGGPLPKGSLWEGDATIHTVFRSESEQGVFETASKNFFNLLQRSRAVTIFILFSTATRTRIVSSSFFLNTNRLLFLLTLSRLGMFC